MTKILAGNWKMHKTRAEAEAFFKEVLPALSDLKSANLRLMVCPSPTLLECCVKNSSSKVQIFAQNVGWEEQGAFTGETSSQQLKDLGVMGTLVGHSERRTLFGDTDERCAQRALHALQNGLEVLYCVGETLADRQAGRTRQVLDAQLSALLQGGAQSLFQEKPELRQKFLLAYEPVWAIGTGQVASLEQVQEAHDFLKTRLEAASLQTPILYGGSVKKDNIQALAGLPAVAGALVGGASLQAADYLALAQALAST